jgi:glycosyltransferase involved in cell wall biosynthesis
MNKKINVLHLTFDMRIGGTEQVIKNLVEATDLTKFNVSILCIEAPVGPFGKLLTDEGVTVDAFQRKNGLDFTLINNIRQYIKRHKIDVIHCHQYTPWVYGVFSTVLLNCNVVFTEHGRFYPDSGSWKRRIVNPVLSCFTSAMTSISQATKTALVEYEYLNAKKIDVVYNGIFKQKPQSSSIKHIREKYALDNQQIVFGTIARLDPIKNQTLLLRAFQLVLKKSPYCKLIIVGDGEERDKLVELTEVLKISDSVIFTGYITEPINYLTLMDVFLLPSLSEGTSMTLLEAMSMGIPCVVTNAGGNPEVILDDFNGYVTPNNEVEPFAHAMLELANNDEQRLQFGKNSAKRFEDVFTNKVMSSSYMEIYNKVSDKK